MNLCERRPFVATSANEKECINARAEQWESQENYNIAEYADEGRLNLKQNRHDERLASEEEEAAFSKIRKLHELRTVMAMTITFCWRH